MVHWSTQDIQYKHSDDEYIGTKKSVFAIETVTECNVTTYVFANPLEAPFYDLTKLNSSFMTYTHPVNAVEGLQEYWLLENDRKDPPVSMKHPKNPQV